jgi:predicted ATP-grasp superfamily ATP-dependent carboligase
MYCDVTGGALPAARDQCYTGAKWWDMRRDLQSAVTYWRGGELGVRDYVASVRGPKAHAVWSARDPAPFVADLVASGRKAAAGWRRASP